MKIRAFIAVFAVTAGGAALAQQQQPLLRKTIQSKHKFTLAPGGTFVLENPIGNVDVRGSDVVDVEANVTTILTAQNQAAMDQASKSGVIIGPDPKTRVVRTAIGAYMPKKQWAGEAHWTVKVPRNASVRILSTAVGRIRVSGVNGAVRVKNFNGSITIVNVTGAVVAESVNGSIAYSTAQPRGNVVLATLNGHVTASVASNADLRWVAETATGDIRTNLPARGTFFGGTFRGSVNAPGGPTISTSSLMGNIHLLAAGTGEQSSQTIRRANPDMTAPPPPTIRNVAQGQSAAGGPRVYQRGIVKESIKYATSVGDVKIAQIRGDADVMTGAGEVQIGSVSGTAVVRSEGGPLQLGEVLGVLTASTRAGDIFIDSTRRGGTISTQGGTIRLLYTGGPTKLTSGGGDIVVRQAAGPVNAETTSGDITISVDAALKSGAVQAKTAKGNVVLNVDPRFAADIDATITTANPNADTFLSDIPGLTVNRSQAAGKTLIRATGKINGGGQKVVLNATDGDIRITTGRVAPTIVKPR
ncbi:MAG TPA: DUF4097 family beta strand repeat-containing protein [Thermoanaerobaculia bacterium]|nr:DUF4097 family beta strand repeat-containing protein [Thermoanaerobaculia bacterium]